MKKGCVHKRLCTMIVLLLCLLPPFFFVTGCGKKTQPVPPGQVGSKPVINLTKKIHNSTLTLNWGIAPSAGEGTWERFVVFRSRTGPGEENCRGCPIIFQPIAHLPIQNMRESSTGKKEMHFQEELEEGSGYAYKVTGYTANDTAGYDSTIIKFNF